MGYYEKLEDAAAAIEGGVVKVNNVVCVNPHYKIKLLDVVSLDMQAYVDIRAARITDILKEFMSTSDVTLDVKRRILGQAADFLKKNAAVARLRGEGFSMARYLFFQKLLSSVVKKFSGPKINTTSGGVRGKKVPSLDSQFIPSHTNPQPYDTGVNYSLADLGTGTDYSKFNVRPAPTPLSELFTPSRVRRMLRRALKEDSSALSSSFDTSNDIFFKFNNICIFLRRPHTINELFETTSVPATNTYNPYVIREFYSSRFEK